MTPLGSHNWKMAPRTWISLKVKKKKWWLLHWSNISVIQPFFRLQGIETSCCPRYTRWWWWCHFLQTLPLVSCDYFTKNSVHNVLLEIACDLLKMLIDFSTVQTITFTFYKEFYDFSQHPWQPPSVLLLNSATMVQSRIGSSILSCCPGGDHCNWD